MYAPYVRVRGPCWAELLCALLLPQALFWRRVPVRCFGDGHCCPPWANRVLPKKKYRGDLMGISPREQLMATKSFQPPMRPTTTPVYEYLQTCTHVPKPGPHSSSALVIFFFFGFFPSASKREMPGFYLRFGNELRQLKK